VESKKAEPMETETRMVVNRCWGVGEREILIKENFLLEDE